MAGTAAMVGSYPFDLLRTRLAAQGEPKVFASITHVARAIFAKEGPLGFYRGWTPSLLQVALGTGVTFFAYESFSEVLDRHVCRC